MNSSHNAEKENHTQKCKYNAVTWGVYLPGHIYSSSNAKLGKIVHPRTVDDPNPEVLTHKLRRVAQNEDFIENLRNYDGYYLYDADDPKYNRYDE